MTAPRSPARARVRLSLRARWTLVLLTLVLTAIAVYAAVGAGIQRRGLSEAERALEVAVIDHVADLFLRSLADAADATHRVGLVLTESSISDDDARLRLAQDAFARADALAQVAIYGPDGALIDAITRKHDSGDAPPPRAPAGDAWLAPEYHDGRVTLRWLEAVDRDGERRAQVLGTLGPGLAARLAELSRDRFDGRDDGLLILDGDMRVLIGPAAGPLAVGTSLRGADVLHGLAVPAAGFNADFAAATEFTAADGEAMLGTLRSIADHDLAVVARRPASAVYTSLRAAQQLLWIAGAGLALVAVVIGGWLAGKTTRSVARLAELTRAYARRDFSARWTDRSGDEMDLLGDAMGTMADQLAADEREIARRAAVEADLSRFLPAEVAKSIAAGKHALALGGQRRTVSVLFADVVAFTGFSESAPPEQVVAFLNELFGVLSEVVFRHGGTVDKFIGDCVMAIFNAPEDQPDHAARALAAAEDMHRFVETSAPAWQQKYGLVARLGIGVNTGEALVGNLGSDQRMEYTAIGDAINVAARLEALARPGQTLVTAELAAAAGPGFEFEPRGEHPLRGKQRPVEILELR